MMLRYYLHPRGLWFCHAESVWTCEWASITTRRLREMQIGTKDRLTCGTEPQRDKKSVTAVLIFYAAPEASVPFLRYH